MNNSQNTPGAGTPQGFVRETEGLLAPMFEWLDLLRTHTEPFFSDGAHPPQDRFSELWPAIGSMLDELGGLISGCGFMSSADAVLDTPLSQEWWYLREGAKQRLALDFDPTHDSFYDYSAKDYFLVPERTHEPYVEGPYVDYLGTDEYIVTVTVPVTVDGRFCGVVGADMPVRNLETSVLPFLQQSPVGTVLLNRKGRVILSNDISRGTGSLVRDSVITAVLDGPFNGHTTVEGAELWPFRSVPWVLMLSSAESR